MKKIVVGMSGGVDSSCAAALLKEQGFEVIGLFMRNWHEEGEDGVCTAEQDFQDVKDVCGKLDVPYYSVDFSKEYMDRVFKLFVSEYKKGRTPNPDVLCNKEIKFDAFLEHAKKASADFVATGHYAAIIDGKLCRAKDENKDQTYFLNQLHEGQLKDVMFPLGEIEKPEVRKLAQKYGLSTAEKKDSTGVCFIGERNFREFLKNYIPMKEGDIKTLDGRVVGAHSGVYYYTVGQRKGLGIGGGRGDTGEPWFVVSKDVEKNILYVCQGENPALYSTEIITDKFNFIGVEQMFHVKHSPLGRGGGVADGVVKIRIRHRQPLQGGRAELLEGGGLKITFDEPQRGAAEGQYAVLYDGRVCLGGGVIIQKN